MHIQINSVKSELYIRNLNSEEAFFLFLNWDKQT